MCRWVLSRLGAWHNIRIIPTRTHTHTHANTFSWRNDLLTVEWLSSSLIHFGHKVKKLFFIPSTCLFRRTEPQCITCDGDVLWSSRYYYDNCSHFGAHIAPQSSISSDAGVDYYILECRGPGLPLAGEFFFSSSQLFFCAKKRKSLARWKTVHWKADFSGSACGCVCACTR